MVRLPNQHHSHISHKHTWRLPYVKHTGLLRASRPLRTMVEGAPS